MYSRIFLVLFSVLITTPVFAQAVLEVPANANWLHQRSKLVLPPSLGGLKRGEIADNTESELDVTIQYRSGDTVATLYIYRPYWNDVGVWFDRSHNVLMANESFKPLQPHGNAAEAFARSDGSVKSGLVRAYRPEGPKYKSTGLAILPFEKWFLKLRYSSESAEPEAALTQMQSILTAVGVKGNVSEGTEIREISDCPKPVKWKKAKIYRQTMIGAMLEGTVFVGLMEKKTKKSAYFDFPGACRDGPSTPNYTIYRDLNNRKTMVMAALDAGLSIEVVKVSSELISGRQYWPIKSALASHELLPAFTRLPKPEQLFAVLLSGQIRAASNADPDAPAGQKQDTVINVPAG